MSEIHRGVLLSLGLIGALAYVPAGNLAHADAALTAGQSAYAANCVGCHGARLGGGAFGPPLSGKVFEQKWQPQGAAALLAYVTAKMPPARPGSLDSRTYADVTRYILSKNGLALAAKTPSTEKAAVTKEHLEVTKSAGQPSPNQDDRYRAATARRTALLDAMTPVTDAMLRNPPNEDWLNWRRTDDGFGYSPLDQINTGNADRIQLAWSLSLPAGNNEIIPLVHDGVMFINASGTVQALDVDNGDSLWTYTRQAGEPGIAGLSAQPRSMAIHGTTLYVPTRDNHMLALDSKTGALLWDHTIEKPTGTLRLTGGPMVVHGKVIQGMSGCIGTGQPGGCFIVALDAQTGAEAWRFNTVAHPGQPGGDTWNGAPLSQRFGGSVWDGGTYDAELNLVYFGTGQTYHATPLLRPQPADDGSSDALYTDTTLALNPDTGALVWHYQHLARDVWDMDWAFERTILTLPNAAGTPTKMVVTFGKLGILDALDAKTGRYLFSHDLGLQNMVTAIDPQTGRKTIAAAVKPEAGKTKLICPHPFGVRNWPATAYDPATKTMYVPMLEFCSQYLWTPNEDFDIRFTISPRPDSDGNFGRVAAINLNTRQTVWQQRRRTPLASAVLATAGGLVFEGSTDRWFRASASASGKVLWQTRLNLSPSAFPISFAKDGTQYVSITTGGGGPLDASFRSFTPEVQYSSGAVTLWVFKLAGAGAVAKP